MRFEVGTAVQSSSSGAFGPPCDFVFNVSAHIILNWTVGLVPSGLQFPVGRVCRRRLPWDLLFHIVVGAVHLSCQPREGVQTPRRVRVLCFSPQPADGGALP